MGRVDDSVVVVVAVGVAVVFVGSVGFLVGKRVASVKRVGIFSGFDVVLEIVCDAAVNDGSTLGIRIHSGGSVFTRIKINDVSIRGGPINPIGVNLCFSVWNFYGQQMAYWDEINFEEWILYLAHIFGSNSGRNCNYMMTFTIQAIYFLNHLYYLPLLLQLLFVLYCWSDLKNFVQYNNNC